MTEAPSITPPRSWRTIAAEMAQQNDPEKYPILVEELNRALAERLGKSSDTWTRNRRQQG